MSSVLGYEPKRSHALAAVGILAVAAVYVASEGNPLAAALLQAITLAIGVGSSFYFGRNAAAEGARDVLRPHARNSFRSLLNLFDGLRRIGNTAAQQRQALEKKAIDGQVQVDVVAAAFEMINIHVVELARTADSAVAGWRDILPDEVAELEQRAEEQLD